MAFDPIDVSVAVLPEFRHRDRCPVIDSFDIGWAVRGRVGIGKLLANKSNRVSFSNSIDGDQVQYPVRAHIDVIKSRFTKCAKRRQGFVNMAPPLFQRSETIGNRWRTENVLRDRIGRQAVGCNIGNQATSAMPDQADFEIA